MQESNIDPRAFKLWLLGDPSSEDGEKQIGMLNRRGLSVQELAASAKLSATSIYGYIANSKKPTPENLRKICVALSVPYAEGQKYIKTSKTGRPFKVEG